MRKPRLVMGLSEVAIGVIMVALAAARSPSTGLPSAVATVLFGLLVAVTVGRSAQLALLAKPYNMSRRPVIIGAAFLVIPMTILVVFYSSSLLVLAIFGPVFLGEIYRQLFAQIEPREEDADESEDDG